MKTSRLFGLFFLLTLPLVAQSAEQPHIVFFMTDDHTYLDSTPYGDSTLNTPNMQRLADEGLTFDHAYVVSPTCAPSRAALLTGLMPARNGAEPNHARPAADLKKWPAYFQDLGYEVVAFGKVSHYKHTEDYGFDHFAHDTFHDHGGIPAAVKFLKERDPGSAKPLCLFVGSNWPHVPWPQNDGAYDPASLPLPAGSVDTSVTREWRARYAAAVTRADDELGVIHEAVRETLGDNVISVFSGDHGAQWPFGKWNLYDAGIRVPLIVKWPGVVEPGGRSGAMVSWVDFLPTLLEAVGGEAPEDIDGESFLSVLRGEKGEHRDRIFTTHSGDGHWNIYLIRSVRTRNWKYIRNLYPNNAYTTHIDLGKPRDGAGYWASWKEAAESDEEAAAIVRRYHKRPPEELYDLRSDPGEERNLAGDPRQAERLEAMRGELEEWMNDQGDERTVYGEPRPLEEVEGK